MNQKMVFSVIGRMLKVEAALLLLPAAVSLGYKENCIWAFLISAGIALAVGLVLSLVFRPKDSVIYAKEGFAIVALVWLGVSAIGALPFVLSGEIPSYVNAFFETVSGFTTTGSSILINVESLSNGILFWRSFTHWIGGMGVLIFIMAIVPNVSDRSIHILRAEMPGPVVGKLVPRVKDTAKILYLIYLIMTVAEVVFLVAGGMPVFDSVVHAFGTAGTGGFSIHSNGIASYSPYLQWVITIFMLMFGINFNLYYLILMRRFKSILRSTELWCYLAIALIAVITIFSNIYPIYNQFESALRASAFQVSSILTTTGYSTVDFNLWPGLSKTVLLLLMFVGGCAGSTAGGLKVSRVIMLFKLIGREFKHMLRPKSVSVVKFEGKQVDETTLGSISIYFVTYMVCVFLVFLLLSFDAFDFETNFSATVACFNNIGPGFGAVGPAASFVGYSDFSKILLSIAMLMGRLEIFPLILAFSPVTWSKE